MLGTAFLGGRAEGQQQTEAAALSGLVLDPAGAVVPGAEVTVYEGSAVIAQQKTDFQGVFRFEGMPREYRVDVQSSGFATLHSSPIPFTAAGPSRFTMFVQNEYTGPQVLAPPALRGNSQARSTGSLNELPVRREANVAPWEFGALFQGGVGLTEDRGSFRFLLAGGHLGKVLTPELGTGLLRGDFEYAGELFPYWEALTPTFPRISCTATSNPQTLPSLCSAAYTVGGNAHGVSVTPIILRWNFTRGQRWMPWVQGAGGVVWTNHKFPAYGDTNRADSNETGPGSDTSVWNFTPQFGLGTHLFLKPKRSLDFGANAVHISSASLGDRNPGVNASVQFSVGYSWWSR